MKFFLSTVYRISKDFAGSSIEIKTQGLGQGNGASQAGWCMISIMILWAHGVKENSTQFIVSMSQVRRSLLAILHVDGHLNMERDESVQEVPVALQQSIENWGKAMGGNLKPDKCLFHCLVFA
jgi:hypothetical protein